MSKKKMKSEETGAKKISEQTTGGVQPMNDEELTGIVGGSGNEGNNVDPPPDNNDLKNEDPNNFNEGAFSGYSPGPDWSSDD